MRVWTVHTLPDAEEGPDGAGPVRADAEAPPPPPPPAGKRRRRPASPVVLVREGFAWAAFFFGVLWLLWHRLWLAALLYLLLAFALGALLPAGAPGAAAALALQFLLGAHANDLRRRALAHLGYRQSGVVAERDTDLALARVLAQRPALVAPLARAALA